MSDLTRRQFVTTATTAAAGAALASSALAAEPDKKRRTGADMVALGKSGLKTTLLGIGTGTRGGSEQRNMGSDKFTRMIRHALDRGIRFLDTADRYMTHVYFQQALKEVKREDYFLLTKVWSRDVTVAKDDIERFRRELNQKRNGYFDLVLMHCMNKDGWVGDQRPVLDMLLEHKRKGLIRAIGVSCHGWDPLVQSIGCKDLDVQLVRINPYGEKMDGKPADVVAQVAKIKAQGRGILGMKIYGETGYDAPEKRQKSIKFALDSGVDAMTIGFSSIAQIDETMDLIEKASVM